MLGSLELNGKFVGQNGNLISFSDYQNITVYGGKMENDKWIKTEHTGKLSVQNNKIVSETITVSGVYVENEENVNRNYTVKFEIALNPDDATTLLVTQTSTFPWLDFETTYTNVYIPVETAKPNFDGTWTFGENKLIIKNGKYAIVDDSQVLYSGGTWWWTDVENSLGFEYYTSEENRTQIDGYLARSGKFYICIWTPGEPSEYKILTKISDSIEVDFDSENPLVGKYKTLNNEIFEITDSSVTLNGDMRFWADSKERIIKNPSIDYNFTFMDFNSNWIELGEKEITVETVEWNYEKEEYETIETETYLANFDLYIEGESFEFSLNFGDKIEEDDYWYYEYRAGVRGAKFKQGPVDFTGTWVLSDKIHDNEEFTDAQITINNDGSSSVFVDGKEIEHPEVNVDMETANNENRFTGWNFIAIITESGKLYADFTYKYDAEANHSWSTTAFFTKL